MHATRPFDPTEYLEDEESILLYLEDAFKSGSAELIVLALGDVARARNTSKLAQDAGISREGLYKSFSKKGNPSFATVSSVMSALGYQLSVKPLDRQEEGDHDPELERLMTKPVRQAPAAKSVRRAG